jgi:hypothetical protein
LPGRNDSYREIPFALITCGYRESHRATALPGSCPGPERTCSETLSPACSRRCGRSIRHAQHPDEPSLQRTGCPRKYSLTDQCFTDLSEVRSIYGQHLNRCAADGSQSDLDSSLNLKVLAPDVRSRVKQTHDFAAHWIAASDIWPLVPIAVEAGQGQIINLSCTVMLSCNDMIDLKRKTVVRKRNQAVFAPLSGSLPNFLNQPRVHGRG